MVDSNSILQGVKLDFAYKHPRVYDGSLNIAHPEHVYKMSTVYRKGSKTGETSSGNREPDSRHDVRQASKILPTDNDSSGETLEAISRALLSQQEKLLTKVKHLHMEVDQLEKFLRKDKTVKPDPQPAQQAVGVTSEKLSFSAQLKDVKDPVEIADIISREEQRLLERLHALRENVDRLAQRTLQHSSTIPSTRIASSFSLGKKEHCAPYLPLDVVVHASPKNPPLSLLVILKGLQQIGAVKTATFVHSSVPEVPDRLRYLIDGYSTTYSRQDADFLVTLIWKDVGIDPVLLLNPSKHNPILAESNIVRFFLRLLNPEYDAPKNIATYETNNRWLNAASKSLVHGGSKEKQSVVRNLNSHLGKSTFLSGTEPGLLDTILLSALLYAGELKSPTGNVKKWLAACSQQELFENLIPLLRA